MPGEVAMPDSRDAATESEVPPTGAIARATESLREALQAWNVPCEPSVLTFLAAQLVALAEGGPDTRAERRREQRARLEILGLAPMSARQILRDLDLPGQPTATDAVVTPHVYHPYRIRTLLTENPGLCQAWSRYAEEAEAVDTVGDDNPVVALIAAARNTPGLALLPGDRTALDRYNVSGLSVLAHFACSQIGGIIDAENALRHYAGRRPSLGDFAGLPHSSSRYVHFGRDALPSPYPGLGIEGCYVVRGGPDEVCALLVVPVVSAPRTVRTPADHSATDTPVQVLLDHGRAFPVRYDQGFRRMERRGDAIPEDRPDEQRIAAAWEAYFPAALAIAAGVIDEVARRDTYLHMIVSADADPAAADRVWNAWSALYYDPKSNLVGTAPHEEPDLVAPYVLGFHPVSAQYPDEGGGFPLSPDYWPTRDFVPWIDAFIAKFQTEATTDDARADGRHHGWIDRAVRLVQQAVPNRADLPTLAARPEIETGVRRLLLAFPVEGSGQMAFWQALRWLVRIDPVAAELRIHCLIAQSVRTRAIREVAHVLFREMPDGPPARRAWADVAQCLADSVDDPDHDRQLASLVVRAYSADPDLAERLINEGCTPETLAEAGAVDGDENFVVLGVYGGILRELVRTLPNTMTLLRTRGQTHH